MRLKTIRPLEDGDVEKIRSYLRRWRLLSMEPPRRTMFHAHPTDFGHVDGAEVWIVDFEIGIPAPGDVIAWDIADLLKTPRSTVVCVRKDEGRELSATEKVVKDEAEALVRSGEVRRGGVMVRGGEYGEVERGGLGRALYGPEWNRRLLASSAENRKMADPVLVTDWIRILPEPVIDVTSDPDDLRPKDGREFLDGYGPKPVYREDPREDDPDAEDLSDWISRWGNVWRPRPTVRHFTDEKGRPIEHAPRPESWDRPSRRAR